MIIWWQNTAVSIKYFFSTVSLNCSKKGNKTIDEQESLFYSESEQES